MKKFDIKWILILVLVIILAFGLVACNNGGGGNEGGDDDGGDTPVVDPNKSTPSEFFGALWESSKSIGATPVNPATDKVHIGMAMDLSLTSNDVAELDVGIEFGIVADLAAMNKDSNPDLGDTALMMKAFDKVTGDNWVTLWYFIQDPDYLYFQVQDENFKVAFDAYWNDEFSTLLEGVLQMPIDFLKVDNLLTLINGIAASGGSDWSLDTLVLGNKSKGGSFDGLLAAFGLNLSEILENDTVKSILGKNTDTSSLGSILQSMGGVVLDSSGCKKETVNGRTVYTASKLSKTATTLLNGFTDNLFNSISALSLSFGVKDNKIDGLTIAITGKKDLNNTEIKINITDLTIEKVAGTTAATTVLKKADSYKSYANLHFSGVMDASAWGIVINPNNYPISIGRVTLDIDACLDLVGTGSSNKTVAGLTLMNGTTTVLKVAYKNQTLTLQTDLTDNNNKNIAMAALYPLAEAIKEAAVGTKVAVPYKVFGDLAGAVLNKTTGMFTWTGDEVTGVNASFDTIAITGVDIAVLAKGAFYAIFSDFATGAGDEKPGEVVTELTTWDGASYIYKTKEYTKGQYAWSLDIAKTAAVVLKAIKYNGGTATTDKTKDYSIDISSIASTLKGIFKKASVESVDKSAKTEVAAPTNVDEMMALFMCTNDGLILDLTRHGLLPLYNASGITDKYIGDGTGGTLTEAQAVAGHYYAMPGKMISKADALCIWKFYTGATNTIKQPVDTKGKVLENTVIASEVTTIVNGEGETYASPAAYAADSAIAWFVKFMNGTTLLSSTDMTAARIVEALTGTNSSIKISLNRKTGYMGCEITLAGKKLSGTAEYKFFGSNDNATSLAKVPTITGDADYTVALNDDTFYPLFKAQFGMGDNTDVTVGHGINKDIYYLASDATFVPANSVDEKGHFTSITYLNAALIRLNDTNEYALVTTAGIIDTNITVDTSTANVIVIGGSAAGDFAGTYDIKGVAYLVLDKR